MRASKPGRTMLWAALLFITAILGVNGCGELGNNTAPNDTPIANAGPDQGSILAATLITLNGSASSDPDGQPLTYSWSFVSKPAGSAAVLTNPTRVSPTFTADRVGSYVVRLIVNDGTVNSAPDTVLITSDNVAPVANAGPDQGGITTGTLVTLDGTGSTDGDGDPLTFSWSFTSVPPGSSAVLNNPTNPRPTFTADRLGDYVVQLIVNDGTVNSAPPDTVRITSDNVPPVANAGPDQGGITTGTLVTLDGSGSTDANGDPLTYAWTFVSRPDGSSAVLTGSTTVAPTFIVDRDGMYVVELIVNDGTVNSLPATVTITSSNVAPEANAGPNQGGIAPGTLITLDGSGSTDANGDPLTYSWSLSTPTGSAAILENPTSVSPTFTADRAGPYVAQLIVNDGTVNSLPATVTITIINVVPVANAGSDQTVGLGLVTLNGTSSSDNNGDPLTYSWLLSSPPDSIAVLDDPTSPTPTFTADLAGIYEVQLVVIDGTQDSPSDSVTITAN